MSDHSAGLIAEGFVVLDGSGKTAPNGKPAGQNSAEDIALSSDQESGIVSAVNTVDAKGPETPEPKYTLPPGWEERECIKGKPYFVDHNTRTTTWVRPIPSDESTFRPLPEGWERRRTHDVKRRIYYVDHNTKSCSWDFPEDTAADGKASHQPDSGNNITSTKLSKV
ncbi:MAG: hypothetical protein Q9169_006724 [Polycauliona sp. 2 TL-2023]